MIGEINVGKEGAAAEIEREASGEGICGENWRNWEMIDSFFQLSIIGEGMEKLAEGAEKVIYVERSESGSSVENVYVAPRNYLGIISKSSSLMKEVRKCREISGAIPKDSKGVEHPGRRHLDLEWSSSSPSSSRLSRIVNLYSKQRAEADLERFIRHPRHFISDDEPDFTFRDRVDFCMQLLLGIEALHAAGYVHGDLKLENILVYRSDSEKGFLLKISDFGRSKSLQKARRAIYKGNTRFAPPQGGMTQQGDLYALSMIFLRIFEEELSVSANGGEALSGYDSLLEIEDYYRKELPAASFRRGLERFVLTHKDFVSTVENSSSLSGKLLNGYLRSAMPSVTGQQAARQRLLLEKYESRVFHLLRERGVVAASEADLWMDLLFEMREPKEIGHIYSTIARFKAKWE